MKVYAFVHTAEVVNESASGGAFSAIVEAFFALEPAVEHVVYGVILNENAQVVYEPAYTLEQCKKFRGSKYVRSNMRGIPELVRGDLESGKMVLFSGTPCFVKALKNALNKWNVSMENLLCVDLICHGTPEERYWSAYKQWLERRRKSKLIDFRFRTHIPGKGPYTAIAAFEDGTKLIGTLETAIFNRLFLRHYTLSAGCFSCRFANLERQGDLTIGDFWGIEHVMPEFPAQRGASEILVNTGLGACLIEWMQKNGNFNMQQCTTMDFVQYQNNLQRPAGKPKDYAQFKREFEMCGMEFIAKKYAGYNLLHRLKAKLCKS